MEQRITENGECFREMRQAASQGTAREMPSGF